MHSFMSYFWPQAMIVTIIIIYLFFLFVGVHSVVVKHWRTCTQLKTAEVHVWSCTLPQAVFEEKYFLLRKRRNMPHYINVIDIMQF